MAQLDPDGASLLILHAHSPDDLIRQVQLLLGYMNQLYDRRGLPEEMNERISQEIAQLIECSLQ